MVRPTPFLDRRHAGRVLAEKLADYAGQPNLLVLALPRGGVPVAFEVARALPAPLDVFTVRKLGVPGHEELAMGAIATGGVTVVHRAIVESLGIAQAQIDQVARAQLEELRRRERQYRGDAPPPVVHQRTVILIDDGLATGSSMHAAATALRHQHPARLIVAVPVAPAETCEEFHTEVDRIICALTPEPFHAVSLWYRNFAQTTDDDVRALLDQARQEWNAHLQARPPTPSTTE